MGVFTPADLAVSGVIPTDGAWNLLTSTGAGSPPAFEALPASGITLGYSR